MYLLLYQFICIHPPIILVLPTTHLSECQLYKLAMFVPRQKQEPYLNRNLSKQE